MIINGTNHDMMDAWHILNSDLNKGLGFVTPFICSHQRMWKHESAATPALYNAIDASTAGMNARGIIKLLKQHKMWDVYREFILEVDPVFSAMTKAGMPVDLASRVASSKQLIERRKDVHSRIEAVVPREIRTFSPPNGYVRPPKDLTGLTEITVDAIKHKECPNCQQREPNKSHFKSMVRSTCSICGAKWTAKHSASKRGKVNPCSEAVEVRSETNPCAGRVAIEIEVGEKRWARIEDFKVSPKSIQRYQLFNKHPFIFEGKGAERKISCDEKALKKLIGKHPGHEFYSLAIDDRELGTIGSRYIGWLDNDSGTLSGGFPVGRDGRIHGHFRHTPSTLRSSMVSPSLQNVPRGDDSEVQAWVKQMFVAPPGMIFIERDFSGIEAKLVGYHCGSKDYIRLASIDVHSYLTAHNLYRQGKLLFTDLPNLNWSDSDLRDYLKTIKKKFPFERTIAKICVHCVTGDHEVLTPTGWVRFEDYKGEKLAQWDNGNLSFVQPTDHIVSQYNGPIHTIEGRSISAVMTPQHRIPWKYGKNTPLREMFAEEINDADAPRKVPIAGVLEGGTQEWGYLSLAIATQADGCVTKRADGYMPGYTTFHFTKQRKIIRLTQILSELGVKYTVKPCSDHPNGVLFSVKSTEMQSTLAWLYPQDKEKRFKLDMLMRLSKTDRLRFLTEILDWDASKSHGISGKQTCYVSTSLHNAEAVQTMAHITGRQALLRSQTKRGYRPIYRVSFNARTLADLSRLDKQEVKNFKGTIYCVTVPSGWFIIRHNGKISITGNSANYRIGPKHLSEQHPTVFHRIKDAAVALSGYYEVFPEIPKWHERICLQVDKTCVYKNAFGHIQRFYDVLSWSKKGNQWVWDYSNDSKRLIAAGPQSDAALIGKKALKRMFYNYPDTLAKWLRLFIHDSVVIECPIDQADYADEIMRREMEALIIEMPLDPTWEIGEYLAIGTESKRGPNWGGLK